jgi:hypothetical protein
MQKLTFFSGRGPTGLLQMGRKEKGKGEGGGGRQEKEDGGKGKKLPPLDLQSKSSNLAPRMPTKSCICHSV